ncbi:MAG TPA: HupE/UreJ family protein [Luteolibacter sp.]|nr:HupE/UreJ family protein [Luteolibacter sp.]
MSQLYGEFHDEGASWHLDILFDAGFADPAQRNDPATPQPTREWLVSLDTAEQWRLAEEARRYLGEIVTVRSDEAIVDYQITFPDFDKSPPDFPILLNKGAYFHARIAPVETSPGNLSLHMAAGSHPDLVIKLPTLEQATYLTLVPGGEVVLKSGGVTAEGRQAVAAAFVQGVLHVVPHGLDHILFILGIFLLQRRWKPLLTQSLAFTAAHTVTLGLAAAGVLSVPGEIVEPLIALSITALAVENLFVREAGPWRLCLVSAFGLVHGLGFAGVLSAWIPPGQGFLPALIAANLGVETGQVAVLATAWIVTLRWHAGPVWPPFRKGACILLALAGLWWFAERTGLLPAFA